MATCPASRSLGGGASGVGKASARCSPLRMAYTSTPPTVTVKLAQRPRDLQARPRGSGQDSTPGRPGDGSRDDVACVRAGEGPANVDRSDRRSLLVAALGFVLFGNRHSVPEVVTLHAWLDTWSGLGAIVVGMERHGFELWLAKDRNGWRSTFLHRSHVMQPWVGQVLYWWPTPWRAVQEAAWRALSTPFARDYSVIDDSPQ